MPSKRKLWPLPVIALLLTGGVLTFWLLHDSVPAAPSPTAADSGAADGLPVRAADTPADPPMRVEDGGAPPADAAGRDLASSTTAEPERSSADKAAAPDEASKRAESEAEDARMKRDRAVLEELEAMPLPEKDTIKFKVTLAGVVVNANGTPAGIARILVNPEGAGDQAVTQPATPSVSWGQTAGRSEASGYFRFEFECEAPRNTTSLQFAVSAVKPRPMAMASSGETTRFSLPNGGIKDDLRLQLPAEGKIKGRVVDSGGNPVVRATVQASYTLSNGGGMSNLTTGADGPFVFESLEPRAYTITAAHKGQFSPAEGTAAEVIADQTTIVADLVLAASAALIVDVKITGVNFEGDLTLEWYAESGARLGQTSARLGKDGETRFANLPAGTLRFQIQSLALQPSERQTTNLRAGEEYKYGTITLVASPLLR